LTNIYNGSTTMKVSYEPPTMYLNVSQYS